MEQHTVKATALEPGIKFLTLPYPSPDLMHALLSASVSSSVQGSVMVSFVATWQGYSTHLFNEMLI